MAERDFGTTAGVIVERRLHITTSGAVICLDAVTTDAAGRRQARLFFATGTDAEGLRVYPDDRDQKVHNFGGAPVVDCAVEAVEGVIPVLVGGELIKVGLQPDETSLFADLNVILAVRNGEDVATTVAWLKYHIEAQRMQGAVIFDRTLPADSAAYFAELRLAAQGIDGLERLVVLHADVPLGKPDLPDEAHPFNVIGAPGKDRMDVPEADRWRSPLGEFLIYEIVRARFLARARAVANIELYDLVMPTDDGVIFDRAVEATTGCIRLEGRQAYPWRVRNGETATFADHICTQFDSTSVRQRWCVAPASAPVPNVWRLIRVVGTTPAATEGARFYRFMAIRHPNESVSKIVPKSSLIENEELLALSEQQFGGNPVRMPEEAFVHHAKAHPTTTIVTTMKNEGPFILEWIAYHRMIGVDNFLVYTNDCTDGTDTMLKMLQEKGIVQHRENPFHGSGLPPQHAALQAADHEPVIRGSDWLVCMDVDEFINIKCGDGRLPDLFERIGDANMVSMTWRLFGNSDISAYRDVPITEQFTLCAPELVRKPHQAWGFKTLFRNNGIFRKLGVHRPKGLKPQLWEEIRWVNGSGKPMPPSMFRNGWRSTVSTYGYELVQLNHYAVRSAESYLVKRDRGRVNHVDRDQGLAYWFRMNNNGDEDRSIQRMLPALRDELDELLADSEIAAAHDYSVRRHQEKITELMGREEFVELYQDLTGGRLEKLSRLHAHFGANVFLSGPTVIPDEIAEREPGEDFWFTVKRQETAH